MTYLTDSPLVGGIKPFRFGHMPIIMQLHPPCHAPRRVDDAFANSSRLSHLKTAIRLKKKPKSFADTAWLLVTCSRRRSRSRRRGSNSLRHAGRVWVHRVAGQSPVSQYLTDTQTVAHSMSSKLGAVPCPVTYSVYLALSTRLVCLNN